MKKFWVVLVSGLFVLGCLETGLRLLGPFKRAGKTPDHVLWQADPDIGFAPAANLDTVVYSNEWINEIHTDAFGFRIASTAPPSTISASDSILFLGDSQTMAVQVAAQETYVSLIEEELLHRSRPMRVINAGCNGFNTVQEYLFFQKLFHLGVRPRVVVLYVVNNDLFEDVPGLPYGRYSVESADGSMVVARPDPESLERLKRAKEVSANQPSFWLRNSALLRHIWYMYGVLRNPHDVAGWVKNTYLRDDLEPFAAQRWAAATAAVRSLNRLVSSYGGKLIIAVHPDPVEWSDTYYARLVRAVPELSGQIDRMKIQNGYRRVAENVGAQFIDMLQNFPNIAIRDFRFMLDPHANASGHRIIASQLLKGLEPMSILEGSSYEN